MFNLSINDQEIGSLITITNVSRGLAPEIARSTKSVQRRDGEVVTSRKYESRVIKVKFTVSGDVDRKIDVLNRMLPYGSPKKIIFGDQPERYYKAEMNGAGEIDKITRSYARGMFELYCADPFAYSIRQKSVSSVGPKITLQNNGTAVVYPVFTFHAAQNYKFFAIAHPNGNAIQIGYEGSTEIAISAGRPVDIRTIDCSLFIGGIRKYPNMASKSFGVIPGMTEIVIAVDNGSVPVVTATYREAWI